MGRAIVFVGTRSGAPIGFYALEPRIPMFVSGFGPKAMALAGEVGDGLVFSIPRVPTVEDALKLDGVRDALRRGDLAAAARHGRVFELVPVAE